MTIQKSVTCNNVELTKRVNAMCGMHRKLKSMPPSQRLKYGFKWDNEKKEMVKVGK